MQSVSLCLLSGFFCFPKEPAKFDHKELDVLAELHASMARFTEFLLIRSGIDYLFVRTKHGG